MIRMIQSTSSGHAKSYFDEALSKADYFINDQELQGKFEGRLAERLEIIGPADRETFFKLCDNIDPRNSTSLTPRNKEDRTVGYDINFHAPKSVSIVHALSKDNHLLKAFEVSVRDTMHEIEADSMTRVRKKHIYEDRKTGELAYASFTHQTARPVGGHPPDPHLHTHCYVFNATYDSVEQRIKAGQFREINRDMPYYQARFQKRLADNLIELGYQVRRTNNAFEIVGVPKEAIELFSKRTDEIGRVAEEKGISDPKAKSELGAKTRSAKQKGMSMPELRAAWRAQIRDELKHDMATSGTIIRHREMQINYPAREAQDCVNYALKHHFERASVSPERRILEAACKYSIGEYHISLDAIEKSFGNDERIIRVQEKGRNLCTTTPVLIEEREMVKLARKGQGKFSPLYKKTPDIQLKGPQGVAIEYLLTDPHQISLVRGVAGAGKTTMMRELSEWVERTGKPTRVIAPSAEASRGVLVSEGFSNANTVTGFLLDKNAQKELKGGVLFVDEAGLLGTGDTLSLMKFADEQKCRIIFIGDTRQHSSVVRGDAMRILNTVANIKAAEVSQIRRQQNKLYKDAVEDLSKGNVADGFEKLMELNAIKTVDPLKPNEQLIKDYMLAVQSKKSTLIISPTHKQGDAVTAEVREKLVQKGLLGKKELAVTKLVNYNLTEAQRGDCRNYKEKDKIRFNQNVPKIGRGTLWTIKTIEESGIRIVSKDGQIQTLPLDRAKAFAVFREQSLSLRKGDKIRITQGGFDLENKRLENGQALEVTEIKKSGTFRLLSNDGKTSYNLDGNFGHIDHAYCTTSHSSQGKTVDRVFVSQPSATFTATDAKQFYVSVSRGRESVSIYTDDKDELLENASRLGERQSAIELVGTVRSRHESHVFDNERNKSITKDNTHSQYIRNLPRIKDIDYEP